MKGRGINSLMFIFWVWTNKISIPQNHAKINPCFYILLTCVNKGGERVDKDKIIDISNNYTLKEIAILLSMRQESDHFLQIFRGVDGEGFVVNGGNLYRITVF